MKGWERLIKAMLDEPHRAPVLDPQTGELRRFLEAEAPPACGSEECAHHGARRDKRRYKRRRVVPRVS